MIEQTDPFAFRHFQPAIRRSRNAAAPVASRQNNSLLARRQLWQELQQVRIGGIVVDEDQLPFFVNLITDRLDAILQPGHRRVEYRRDYGEAGPVFESAAFVA